jgi:hypothetical protein
VQRLLPSRLGWSRRTAAHFGHFGHVEVSLFEAE